MYQPVNAVCGNNLSLFSDPHNTKNTLCGQKVELLKVKLVVHHVTGSVYKVNRTECERYWEVTQ